MANVRADAIDAFTEVEAIQALAMRLVVLEAHKRKRANIDLPNGAVGLPDRQGQLEGAGLRCLEAEAVAVVFAGHVAGEGVQAVRPPKTGALVLIEGERLLGQGLSLEGLHGEIAVQDVVNLRAVLQVEAVADTLV